MIPEFHTLKALQLKDSFFLITLVDQTASLEVITPQFQTFWGPKNMFKQTHCLPDVGHVYSIQQIHQITRTVIPPKKRSNSNHIRTICQSSPWTLGTMFFLGLIPLLELIQCIRITRVSIFWWIFQPPKSSVPKQLSTRYGG